MISDAFIFLVLKAHLRPQTSCGPSLLVYQLSPFKMHDCKIMSPAHSEWHRPPKPSGSALEQRDHVDRIQKGSHLSSSRGDRLACECSKPLVTLYVLRKHGPSPPPHA